MRADAMVKDAQARVDVLLQKTNARLDELEHAVSEMRLRKRDVEGTLEPVHRLAHLRPRVRAHTGFTRREGADVASAPRRGRRRSGAASAAGRRDRHAGLSPGRAMVRNLVRLVILGLLVHAAVRIVPEFWHYMQFKDAVTEVASYPGNGPTSSCASACWHWPTSIRCRSAPRTSLCHARQPGAGLHRLDRAAGVHPAQVLRLRLHRGCRGAPRALQRLLTIRNWESDVQGQRADLKVGTYGTGRRRRPSGRREARAAENFEFRISNYWILPAPAGPTASW